MLSHAAREQHCAGWKGLNEAMLAATCDKWATPPDGPTGSRPPSRACVERRFSIERGAHPLGGHQLRLSGTSGLYARKVEIECIDDLCQQPNRSRRLPVAPPCILTATAGNFSARRTFSSQLH